VTPARLAYFPRDDFNPYQHLFYHDLKDKGIEVVDSGQFNVRWLWTHRRDIEILHFHWPQAFYRVSRPPRSITKHLSFLKFTYFMWRLTIARSLGYRMVWTIHQVYPHEILHRVLDPLAPLVLSRICHVLLAHDEHTATLARRQLRVPPGVVHVVPLPSYAGAYGPPRPRPVVRAELGVSDTTTVFLCFGGVRAYKNIDVLLQAFAGLVVDDVALMIAGLANDGKIAQRVRATAAADHRVKARLELIPPSEVADLFRAADVAVLPRGDGGTSSSLVLALDMGLPVIAARQPSNAVLTRGQTTAWLFLPGDVASLRQCLTLASTDQEGLGEKRRGVQKVRMTLGWTRDEQTRTARLLSGIDQR